MRFPARKYLPPVLTLTAVATLAVVVQAGATSEAEAPAQVVAGAETTTPTSRPPTTLPPLPPACPPVTTTTYTTTPGGTTYTTPQPTSAAGPEAALTTFPPSSPTFPTPTPRPGVNFALEGWAQASSTYPSYLASKVNDNDVSTELGCAHSWSNDRDRSPTTTPEWVQVRWALPQQVSRVVVHTSDGYQLRDFDVQVLSQNEQWWDTVATYNYNTQNKVTAWFGNRATRGVRILAKTGPSHQPAFARVNEIQAFLY
ncbi:hypothetical protein V5P93_004552 [Actinokineospora auranticolor]|uniref:F5/8 type C domain-containing protein n=1 Tax=Actinokineospora auranticolor TaxID=155976 RepID=A0A2S6GSW7_9PSEU|nr:hypothetical protein [Actinokineospora auranticolor]PPK68342.1 hypothetical protein CLV40_10565 [Actinokineospora auranticolor]